MPFPAIAGSFPRSFLILGTNTSLSISGFIKYDAIYKFQGSVVEVTSGSNSINGNAAIGGLPLNLKGPPGSVTAPPDFNPAKTLACSMGFSPGNSLIVELLPELFHPH